MKLDLTLRTRLVILVLAAIFPLFGLAVLGAVLTAQEAVRRSGQNLEFSASLVAATQEEAAKSVRQVLTAIASMPALPNAPGPECQSFFQIITTRLGFYANLGVANADGQIACDSRGAAEQPPAYAAYLREAAATGGFVIGEYMTGTSGAEPALLFALPVGAGKGQGQSGAVAFAVVNMSAWSGTLAGVMAPPGGRLVATDRRGVVLASHPPGSAVIGQIISSPTLKTAFENRERGVKEGVGSDGALQLHAFLPSRNASDAPFFVAVSTDMSEVVAPSRHRLGLVFLALSIVSLIGTWLAWLVGQRSIMIPAGRVLAAAAQIQRGQLHVRVPLEPGRANSELTHIAEGFNRMADALEQRDGELARELALSRQTARKLRDAQRLGRIGNWEFNLKTQRLWWSDEVYELLGVAPSDFDGRHESFLEFIHPDDRAAYNDARNAAVASQGEFHFEYRLAAKKGGATRWFHQRGSPVFDSDGTVLCRAGVVQEITERKRAEVAIERSAELMARTGEMAKIGGWELLLDRRVLVCSHEVYRIHEVPPQGYTPLAMAIDFYAPEARPAITAAIDNCVNHGTPWDLILPLVTAAGRHIHVHTRGRAIMEGGKVHRVVGAFQDVTEQQQSRAHLSLLETALSRLNDMVLITEAAPLDEPGPRLVYVNDAFVRNTGYRREEVLGQSPRMLQGPGTDRAVLAEVSAALKATQPIRVELANYTKAGQEYWVEMDIVPIAAQNGLYSHFVAVERDVTRRKVAEKALRESELRYLALFESASVPMWVFDAKTFRFLTVNQAAVAGYGYSEEEFLGMTIYDIRSPVEARLMRDRHASGDRTPKSRWEHRRKDGTLFICQVFATPIQYAGQEASFVLALDITAQIKAEAEVQEHLYTLQRAADAAQVISSHQTLDGTMQEAVEQARGVIGAHQAVVSLSNTEGQQTIHAVSLSEKYARYRDMGQPTTGEGIYAMVCETNRAVRMTQAQLEAHPRWRGFGEHAAEHPPMRGWLAAPLIGRNNANIGVLQLSDKYEGDFTLQDEYVVLEMAQLVSTAIENAQLFEEVRQLNLGLEQKVAERTLALARQEALFRALAEQAPQVVWTADTEGKVTYLNRTWIELAGGDMQDWLGNGWFKAIHPDDLANVRTLWKQAVSKGSPYFGTRRLMSKTGAYHTMSYRATPVLSENGAIAFWVGIDADITEITEIEAALRLSNQELEAFSYSVSHDLRSPLNTVDGFSRLLAKHLEGDAGAKPRHYLSRIQAGVAQMGQLIEDLLALAQVSRTQLRHEQIDLSQMAHKVLEDWQGRAPGREVALNVEEGLLAHGDGRLLRVVLENLLGNAWKFTVNSPAARITFSHSADSAGETVYFVQDNGAGFDMHYADKLFTPFQRLHAVSEFPGTGIGLATVSRVISRHGGRIWADAAPGRGASFFFTLPRKPLSG